MKKTLVIINFLLVFPFLGCTQNSVEGFWSIERNPNMDNAVEREFSWGKRTVPRSFDISIDLHSEPPRIEVYQFTSDRIIDVIEKGDVTEVTFYFARGKFNVTMICHHNKDGTMWIEPLPDGLTFFRTGEDQIYYKIDGP